MSSTPEFCPSALRGCKPMPIVGNGEVSVIWFGAALAVLFPSTRQKGLPAVTACAFDHQAACLPRPAACT